MQSTYHIEIQAIPFALLALNEVPSRASLLIGGYSSNGNQGNSFTTPSCTIFCMNVLLGWRCYPRHGLGVWPADQGCGGWPPRCGASYSISQFLPLSNWHSNLPLEQEPEEDSSLKSPLRLKQPGRTQRALGAASIWIKVFPMHRPWFCNTIRHCSPECPESTNSL